MQTMIEEIAQMFERDYRRAHLTGYEVAAILRARSKQFVGKDSEKQKHDLQGRYEDSR